MSQQIVCDGCKEKIETQYVDVDHHIFEVSKSYNGREFTTTYPNIDLCTKCYKLTMKFIEGIK